MLGGEEVLFYGRLATLPIRVLITGPTAHAYLRTYEEDQVDAQGLHGFTLQYTASGEFQSHLSLPYSITKPMGLPELWQIIWCSLDKILKVGNWLLLDGLIKEFFILLDYNMTCFICMVLMECLYMFTVSH